MMKYIFYISLFSFAISFPIMGQEADFSWKHLATYSNKNIDAWDVNPLSELIISSKNSIIKLDADFQEQFTQSSKSFGEISTINASYSLKTLLFSENNQMLGVADNSLSFTEGRIDLASLGLSYVTHVCYSNQSDRFWVYDDDNSRLICYEGVQSRRKYSEISNLAGITNNSTPTSIFESNNKLFLFYEGDGVFIFDYYGTLIRKINSKEAIQIFPTENNLYLLTSREVLRIDLQFYEQNQIALPQMGIRDIRVSNDYIFLLDQGGVHKYSIK